jgi:signal peptidase I
LQPLPADAARHAIHLGRAASRLLLAFIAGLPIAAIAPVTIGWTPSVVMSGSMMPNIMPGDIVVTSPTPANQLHTGQVIAFAEPGNPHTTVVHRIVSHTPDGSYVTKGDANAEQDSTPIATTAIHGRVRLRIPAVGLPRYWTTNHNWPPVTALAVLIIALIRLSSTGRTTHLPGPRLRQRCGTAAGRDAGRRGPPCRRLDGTAANVLNRSASVPEATHVKVELATAEPGYVWGVPRPGSWRRDGFATRLFQPAANGWYPEKAPQQARPCSPTCATGVSRTCSSCSVTASGLPQVVTNVWPQTVMQTSSIPPDPQQ